MLAPPPNDHSCDEDGGDNSLPALGVEIETEALELKVMVRHGTALHKEGF